MTFRFGNCAGVASGPELYVGTRPRFQGACPRSQVSDLCACACACVCLRAKFMKEETKAHEPSFRHDRVMFLA